MGFNSPILLPLTYLGPVQLYSGYFRGSNIVIEQHDTYQKQSYRNRCEIMGANGKLSLIIPVKHSKEKNPKVKDVRIDYDTDWRRLHWKGIVSAYNSSPYFEFYKDVFEPYYQKKWEFLLDYCLLLNDEILKILKIKVKPELSNEFIFPGTYEEHKDLREIIHPKTETEKDVKFRNIPYTQVFMESHGFISNLSIIDLIFNQGPEALSYLAGSVVTK